MRPGLEREKLLRSKGWKSFIVDNKLQNDSNSCRCVHAPPAVVNDSIAANPVTLLLSLLFG